jgi:hypothetical protein
MAAQSSDEWTIKVKVLSLHLPEVTEKNNKIPVTVWLACWESHIQTMNVDYEESSFLGYN